MILRALFYSYEQILFVYCIFYDVHFVCRLRRKQELLGLTIGQAKAMHPLDISRASGQSDRSQPGKRTILLELLQDILLLRCGQRSLIRPQCFFTGFRLLHQRVR